MLQLLSDIGDIAASFRVVNSALAAWICWYSWRFILTPLLYPREVKELPYLFPFVGHAVSMFTGAHRLFLRGRKRFGSGPWILTIMGESIYVIGAPEDVQAVYKAPKALDFDPFIKDMLSNYQMNSHTITRVFDVKDESGRGWLDKSLADLRLQMHPGEKLDNLQVVLLEHVDRLLSWDKLTGRTLLEDHGSEKIVSLYDWCQIVITDAQTRAFFDESIYDVCPDLLAQFHIFEAEGWKLPLDLPNFATRRLRSSQSYIQEGLVRYMQLSHEKRSKESWLVRSLIDEIQCLELDEAQSALILWSIYRVFHANAFKLAFWIICYLLFNEALTEEIKAEIEPAFKKETGIDLEYIFNSCPLLVSTCEEVMRLTIWSIGTRTVMTDSVVGGKTLRAGRKLLMPYRAMHFDPAVFGADANTFNPRRFMHDKGLIKSTSYRPFGGASHYCPGRFIARREVQVFTAVMLERFELDVPRQGGKTAAFPKMDDTLPSGGIQSPVNGRAFQVRVRMARKA